MNIMATFNAIYLCPIIDGLNICYADAGGLGPVVVDLVPLFLFDDLIYDC